MKLISPELDLHIVVFGPDVQKSFGMCLNLSLANMQLGQLAGRQTTRGHALLQLLISGLLLLDDLLYLAANLLVLIDQVVECGLVAFPLCSTRLVENAVLQSFQPHQVGGHLRKANLQTTYDL